MKDCFVKKSDHRYLKVRFFKQHRFDLLVNLVIIKKEINLEALKRAHVIVFKTEKIYRKSKESNFFQQNETIDAL
jgi:hypothetical protein